MNIGIIGTTLPPCMGGLEIHVWEMAHYLAEVGNTVQLIGYDRYREYSFKSEEYLKNLHVYRTKNTYIFPGYTSYLYSAFKKIETLHKTQKIDIIHAHQAYPAGVIAYFMKKKFDIPYIVTSHGQALIDRARDIRFQPLINLSLKNACRVIGVSNELVQLSIKYGANPQLTIVKPNAVYVKRFHPEVKGDHIRKKYAIAENEIVILTLRRLVPKTGVQYVVEGAPEIIKKNDNVRFLIVGEGELRNSLQARVKSLGIEKHFIFTGSIPNEEVQDYIAASDISVFASLAEATSIACLEVMACAKAVVVSSVGGLPEIVSNGETGVIVPFQIEKSTYLDYGLPQETVNALTQAIQVLVDDPDLRQYLGNNAAKTVQEKFSWSAYIDSLLSLYNEVI